jgi:hypothetical protein
MTLRLFRYYAWANRDPAAMQVWVPYSIGPEGMRVSLYWSRLATGWRRDSP